MLGFFGTKPKGPSMSDALAEMAGNPSVRFVDVRTPAEYREGHIPGSISLPLDEIGKATRLFPDKGTQLYVYCLSGARSSAAVQALTRMGYAKSVNIGGIGSYRGILER